MSTGVLAAGNTAVFKPSSVYPLLGYEACRAFVDAGVPRGVYNFVTGPGLILGAQSGDNPGVDGIVLEKDVGMQVYHHFAKDYPKPVIAEMGGKKPAIVTANRD